MKKRREIILQPYLVGLARKSLDVYLPSRIVKEHNLNTSTIFAITAAGDNKNESKIMLKVIHPKRHHKKRQEKEEYKMRPVGKSFEASSQQASSIGDQ